jgi:hypothetical protein
MPGSEVEVCMFLLLDQWEDMETSGMEAKNEEPGDKGQRAQEGYVHSPNLYTFQVCHWSGVRISYRDWATV